jgi:proteasome lid subunit RPN8/RPN11
MNNKSIYIGKALEDEIRREGEKAYPNECCGVLLGEVDGNGNKILRRIERVSNSREESEQYHRFLITPDELMQIELKARGFKLDILGFYHSHPDHPAKPSDYDREHALPFYSYIITEVVKGVSQDFTSWELSEDRESFNMETITKED